MLNFELIRIALAVLGTGAAAWEDHRTSFIDDRVVLGMMAAGFLLNAATLDVSFILSSTLVALVILGAGYLFYRTGQLGGGDVLLFAGLQLLLPLVPTALLLAPRAPPLALSILPPVFSIFFYSAVLALIGTSVHFAFKLRSRRLKPEWLLPLALLAAFFSSVYVLASAGALKLPLLLVLVLVFLPSAFMAAFKKQISEELLVKRIPLKDFLDEDVVELDAMPPKIVTKYKLGRVATAGMMKKLRVVEKKERIHRFPVYQGLPRFAPYVLAALIALLLLGDAFTLAYLLV